MKAWMVWVLSASCVSAALVEPRAVLADPPAGAAQRAASKLVDKVLVWPLARAESRRSKFSREEPPSQRRVRVLDTELLTDARGKHFVRFAIDARYPDDDAAWQRNEVLGCAYPEDKRVFVRQEDEYVPAASLLGKDVKPDPEACRTTNDLR